MTPWAELLRNQDRRDRTRALMLRSPLWAIKIALAEDPLTVTFDSAVDLGIVADDLVADDQTTYVRWRKPFVTI